MSFLDSVLSSLQTGKPSQLPTSTPPAPPATSSTKRDDRNLSSAPRQPNPSANANGGIKRKADDQLPRPDASKITKSPVPRPLATPAASRVANKPAAASTSKPVPKNGASGTATAAKKPLPARPAPAKSAPVRSAPVKPVKPAAPATPAAPSKAPPKGSFADIMAKAKAMQEKAPTNLLTFKHQTAAKDPSSHRGLKKRMGEAKTKAKVEAQGKKFTPKSSSATRFGKKPSAEPPSRKSSEGPTYKGTAKPTTQTPEPPSYRGTAGLPGKNGGNDHRRQQGKRRMNEYMGTDEEDEGNYGGYEDDFYSDASSDMEAGFDDVEEEEGAALKRARREDEEELRMEMAAKQEKMERQKRLAALASRRR
ncbi:hypothetical protein N7478_008160 [Penicillium angulare]|uniref:uncharacterized protein n=1 Tax=Penicillium angulare TaxID=116970 RepID=UPI002540E7AF|nr:uncharacterized protein N7478_008160 [Penicillium angulare]KAJ5273035.1 hypothetical protein N7478_008160 [Penicillium angulare]